MRETEREEGRGGWRIFKIYLLIKEIGPLLFLIK